MKYVYILYTLIRQHFEKKITYRKERRMKERKIKQFFSFDITENLFVMD